ncbi:MAG: hypothetical protein DSM106950_13250 [Stigonema ocellatum SAG 48.90 = DSM 106950]|nr:hypothetical protein [Stigonema ocellatum SAG 48.90 = DSM 106950]
MHSGQRPTGGGPPATHYRNTTILPSSPSSPTPHSPLPTQECFLGAPHRRRTTPYEGMGFTGQVATLHDGMPYSDRDEQVEFFPC